MIDKRDKARIVELMSSRFPLIEDSGLRIGMGSAEKQNIRFEAINSVGNLAGKRVLDIGCGVGDFYGYKTYDPPMLYTGIDIVPDFIEFAKSRFPEACLEVMDIFDMPDERFDYIIANATFNTKYLYSNNLHVVIAALEKCFRMAEEGIVFTLMSSHVSFQEDKHYYFDPCVIFEFAKTLTKRVTIRHDMPLYEFALFLYPDFRGWRNGDD